jgi:hypothetical protein
VNDELLFRWWRIPDRKADPNDILNDHWRQFPFDIPGQQNRKRPLTEEEEKLLRSDLSDLLSDSKCKDFVEATLGELNAMDDTAYGGSTDVMNIFNQILGGNGRIIVQENDKGRLAEAHVTVIGERPEIKSRFAQIRISPSRGFSGYSKTHL